LQTRLKKNNNEDPPTIPENIVTLAGSISQEFLRNYTGYFVKFLKEHLAESGTAGTGLKKKHRNISILF